MTSAPTQARTLETLLDQARRRIQVTDDELEEARTRRRAIASALRAEFPGARIYVNGSVAHGDALNPLSDIDLGVVIPDPDHQYGLGKTGPLKLMTRAGVAIRERLKPTYGDLIVQVHGRKRSILIRFREPVTPGQADFTADVIVAIDNPHAAGLFIPRTPSWDRSHPEAHTEMVLRAIKDTRVAYARIVRLLKHWNRRNGKPLCSWNIKALALACITSPTTLVDGMSDWFKHAVTELARGETPDPARVAAHPIRLNEPRTEVVRTLRAASDRLTKARDLEAHGYLVLAHDELAKLFNDEDMLPRPDADDVLAEEARKYEDTKRPSAIITGTPALLTYPNPHPPIPARSWAP